MIGNNPSFYEGFNRPVESISWYESIEFCNKLSEKMGLTPVYWIDKKNRDYNNQSEYDELKWLVSADFTANGYRLPTEAEWEYAARGGNKSSGYKYAGSNDLDAVGWYYSNSGNKTGEVGKKQPNELGLSDMSGNVWEWCWDWYSDSYYSSSDLTEPRGPNSGSHRVIRGGSWISRAVDCRVARRLNFYPDIWDNFLGFRLVRTR